ncbi:MAG: hypothetical protein J6Q69_04470 [Clostridia bacterium]|nr:hypothetical protein [Clostridia bacterium]
MKLDKEKLKSFAELSDGEMWERIVSTAKEHGYNLTLTRPSHGELERIRGILRGDERIGLGEAMRLVNTYKARGEKK